MNPTELLQRRGERNGRLLARLHEAEQAAGRLRRRVAALEAENAALRAGTVDSLRRPTAFNGPPLEALTQDPELAALIRNHRRRMLNDDERR